MGGGSTLPDWKIARGVSKTQPMERWSSDETGLESAVRALGEGHLIGFPTETVYGLAGNALDGKVVASIFAAKRRPHFDPLIVHAESVPSAFALAAHIPAEARRLAEEFWPGPLTLVLPRVTAIPDLISAGLETVALRVPDAPIAREVLRRTKFPLAAPSANRFGSISPTQAEHVLSELDGEPAVAGVLDAGPCRCGIESTVVGFPAPGRVVIYRMGGLSQEDLEAVTPGIEVVRAYDAVGDPEVARRGEQSPGMLARHYAPRTPLFLLDPREDIPPGLSEKRILEFSLEELSATGCLNEAAANLFATMRRLDGAGADALVARRVPDAGLGKAINDRLYRASEKRKGM